MDRIKEIIQELQQVNARILVEGKDLRIDAERGVLNDRLKGLIKAHKEDLIDYVSRIRESNAGDIPEAPSRPDYPLSSSQRRLWILSQFGDGNMAYNIHGVYVFQGDLNKEALRRSFAVLIDRHEILRTVFKENGRGEVRQFIYAPGGSGFDIVYRDLRQVEDKDEQLRDLVENESISPFDLANGPLLRAGLFQQTNETWVFTYTMHHIISDGWSMDVLIKELLVLYAAFSRKMSNPLLPLRIQYKDYATWQQEQLNGDALKHHKAYWLKRFGDELPVLELIGDRVRPAVKSYNGSIINRIINPAHNKGLKAFCQEGGSTLFMGLLAAVNALLYRYTGQDDIIIGSPIAGREYADLDNQIGCYINTLALRTQFSGNDSYKSLLENIRQVTLGAYEHQAYPFDELVNDLDLQREMSRSALFDVMVVLQNTGNQRMEGTKVEGIRVNPYEGAASLISRFDLVFIFQDMGHELQLSIEYNSDIYNGDTVMRLAAHLEQLLGIMIANPLASISCMDYLSEPEKQELTVAFNDTAIAYPGEKTIVELFEEQVSQTPDKVALVFDNRRLTYRELNERSNQLAAYLRAQYTIVPDDLVAIQLDRSEWLLPVILAVLKSGGAYVPVDPDYPQERIDHILADSHCRVLIDQEVLVRMLEAAEGYDKANLLPVGKPGDLTYVMYTSGSMGIPKGVMVEHRAVVRLVKSDNYVQLTGKEALLSTGAISFDATTFEYWGMLLNGGKLVLCGKETLLDEQLLGAVIKENGIDTMWFTAGWLNQLVDRDLGIFDGLRTILAGGDKLSPAHINMLKDRYPALRIVNGYGPTENTTFSLTYPIDSQVENIPIGRPISNSTAFVLDDRRQLSPIGVAGEIWVGGAGLARGYLNNPELTMEKFVPHPFRAAERIYKTGDLGRWLPDGNIEFIGRKDDQVKIRGFRIELREIEHALQEYPGMESCVVVAMTASHGEKELAAYTVSKEPLNISDVRAYLSRTLPAYMVPGYFIGLDTLPLNPNGKVDRKRLPAPEGARLPGIVDYVAPRNEAEERLVSIWYAVLGNRQIGVKDDFFELGGHSLKATRLASMIHKEFDVKLTLKELFSTTVLEEQSRLIDRAKRTSFAPIMPVAAGVDHPLSSSQRRLWVLSQFEGGSIAYNIPGVYALEGQLDRAALDAAFNALIERHEILRTVFKEDGQGSIRQFIHSREGSGFAVVYRDLRGAGREDRLAAEIDAEAIRPFDLARGPLLRATLFQVKDDQWVLAYTMHHIISDGWSMGILIKELLVLYNAYGRGEDNPLAPLRIQYKDYAAWQQAQLEESGGVLAEQKRYWLRQFQGELPVLQLPTDMARPAVKSYEGGAISRTLSPEMVEGIKSLTREQGGTLFMGLLAVVNTLLYRYTGQTDIIIGTPIAGREHADLDNQIGFYLNTLALRTQFKGEDNYSILLEQIRQVTLDGYRHQAYPFERLIDDLQLQRDMSRSALFDVLIDLHHLNVDPSMHNKGLEGLTVSPYGSTAHTVSKFDLVFLFTETEEGLDLLLEYNSDLYERATIERLFSHFENLSAAIVATPTKAIQSLNYINREERDRLLHEFNEAPVNYRQYESMVDLFEMQVRKAPDEIAILFGEKRLTYRELDESSTRLGHYLRAHYDIQPDDLIGIMLDRSEKMLIAILGVLRAGGAYVPIDPAYPQARKEYIIADSRIKTLITQTDYIFELEYYKGHVFAIDVQLDDIDETDGLAQHNGQAVLRGEPGQHPDQPVLHPDQLAYVIYTSGSTGLPKGCAITHGNLSNYIQWANNYYFPGSDKPGFGLYTSLSFDLTVTSIFCALTQGGQLWIYDQQENLSDILIHQFNGKSPINSVKLTPSHINLLKHLDIGPSSIQRAIVGGEQVTPEQVSILKRINPGIQIYNEYGPTESTVGCIVTLLEENAPILIGKPICKTSIYILDERGALCPIGVTGEICIGGAGLAKGYLNKEALTAEKFVAHPFHPGERIYKTGDLGKWWSDGNIECFGRKDEQVKIRGYRIEPGEIESVIQRYPGIESTVIIARTNNTGDKELVAYLASKEALSIADLRAHVGKMLPVYLQPAHFVQLDSLPLTPNGKVDRKALPDPDGQALSTGTTYLAPRNEVEKRLVAIWEKILDRERVGIGDSFFELGGDSIKILRMLAELKKELDLQIPVADIYTNNTIEKIASHILENKAVILEQNIERKKSESIVRQAIDALKERILSLDTLPDKDNIEDIYPMSDIEKGMVFEFLRNEGLSVYHDQMIHQRVFPDFDIERFRLAVALLTEKHSILRTSFNMMNYETEVQIVHQTIPLVVPYTDISFLTRPEQQAAIKDFAASELQNPLKVTQAPLWRMNAFNLGSDELVFFFQCHHAIIDGWSDALFMTELNNLYLKLGEDPLYRPEPMRSDYKDYIIQQLIDKQDEAIRDFWGKELSEYTRLDLFAEGEEEIKTYVHTLDNASLRRLEKVAVALDTTVNTISLCAWLYMLKVMNYGKEIMTGLVTNTRPNREDGDKILGCFLNTIPFKMVVDGRLKGADFVKQVHDKLIGLKANERLSLLEIAQVHNKQLDLANPLFDVLFNYVDFHAFDAIREDAGENGKTANPSTIPVAGHIRGNTHFDFAINRTGGAYTLIYTLSKPLKSGLSPEKIGALYLKALTWFIDSHNQALGKYDLTSPEERQKLLADFNKPVNYREDKLVIDLFYEQADKTPDDIAVVFQDKALTYRELNEKSNQLADLLIKQYRIRPDDLVGIKLDRSEWLIIAILGVLKSGGAYVPIDPEYPADRIGYILEDSRCSLLIDAEAIRQFEDSRHLYDTGNRMPVNDPADLAYVIYTSGSTGRPKGVMVVHGAVVNLVEAQKAAFKIGSRENVLQFSNVSFDASVEQIFIALTSGACLTMVSKEILLEPEKLEHFIDVHRITHLHMVPEVLKMLHARKYENLQRVIAGGDRCPKDLAERWGQYHTFYNEYGPTETTVTSIELLYEQGDHQPEAVLPIGRPVDNTSVYILQEDQLLPIGVIGEICIGGAGLARGYLNNPVLSMEKFVNHPFRQEERLYRTGDLGRWLPDGNIAFIGRLDDQVKIRGYRIELGEIEHALQGYEGVESCIVIVSTDLQGEKELVAYMAGKELLDVSAIRAHLSECLPVYMVPDYFIQLESLPLNVNGKVDRKSLPDPRSLDLSRTADHVAPRNLMEEQMVRIWQEVLGREKIGVKDNFFESGGHSLKATRLAGRIHKEFDVVLSLKELLSNPVLESQVQLIVQAPKTSFTQISPVDIQPHYPLSSAQLRLWILSRFEEANAAYNIPAVYVLEGALDPGGLEYAFAALVARHEILRTVFKEDEQGEVRQFILSPEAVGFRIAHHDLQERDGQEELLKQMISQEFVKPFDLSSGPLLRADLFRLSGSKWVFTYTMHHIISDGWSMDVLINELLQLYDAHTRGEDDPLRPLRIQYKDYASWQYGQLHGVTDGESREQLGGGALAEHKAYWMGQFEGELPVLELPGDKTRPSVKTYHGAEVKKMLDPIAGKKISALSQEQGCTLYMGLLALVTALLYKHTGQEDIIIGSPVSGRDHMELEGQIGLYINTLALRTQFKEEESFNALLQRVKKTSLAAFEHQAYPFDTLVDDLDLHRDMSRSPLFDVMMTLQNSSAPGGKDQQYPRGLQVSGYEAAENQFSKFDLVFHFSGGAEGLQLVIEYNTDIYTRQTVTRLADHAAQLMEAALLSPSTPLQELDYISEAEKQQILVQFNDTGIAYPADKTISDLFEEQAARTPDNIALVFEDVSVSYRELNEMANQFGDYLSRRYHCKTGDLIGLKMDRSEWLIIAILGILKSGGAYVPIDTGYPAERVDHMIKDSGCRLMVDEEEINRFREEKDTYTKANRPSGVMPDDLVYVMYTSGSMGVPKGVMVRHRSVVRLVRSANYIHLSGNETLLSTGAISFDATTFEYWGMLLNGGKLVLCRNEALLDDQQLAELITANQVDTMWFTAGWLNQLVDRDLGIFSGLRTILAGGDKLSAVHIHALLSRYPDLKIINGYGPTENTTFSLTYPIAAAAGNIPIGRPISNSTAYILDQRLQLLPIGVAGEICLGGAGLARGYLNNEELTQREFIAHPFKPDERIYRTGDLGRWLPDGNIEFLGRVDDQVKIRGYRIEPGEIEIALQNHPDIDAAVVIARINAHEEKELAAYVVAGEILNVAAVRAHLAKTLPPYMIPTHFVQLGSFPLTPNGKIDRRNLPDPEGIGLPAGETYMAPKTGLEKRLASIWQDILGRERVGLKDNFFELGGHSLKMTRLASRIYKEFELKPAIRELFLNPVLEDQVKLIGQARKKAFVNIPAVSGQAHYPLSSSQRLFWISCQFEEANIAYNMPGIYMLEGDMNTASLEASFHSLVERHESLRTVFRKDENGEVRQFILSPDDNRFKIIHADLRQEKAERLRDYVQTEFSRPFDLDAGPLVRVSLLRIKDRQWALMYVMHHIIGDGRSMTILFKELLLLFQVYSGKGTNPLIPLPIQYKDYSIWQQEQLRSGALDADKAYWIKQFEGDLPVLQLPVDSARPAIKTYNGGMIRKTIANEIVADLSTLLRRQDSTAFMGLLAAVNILLYKYSHQTDIVIGTSIAGREHPDLQDQIGYYLNTLALRTRFSPEDSFIKILENVRELTLDAYEHQFYPFEDLVEALALERDVSRNNLFDVLVVMRNTDFEAHDGVMEGFEHMTIDGYGQTTHRVSKFDLTFCFIEFKDELQVEIEYNSDLFDSETIMTISGNLEQLLRSIVAQPAESLKLLDHLSPEEKQAQEREFDEKITVFSSDISTEF